jgi:apolipoprotein N-acyltransferase
MIAFMAAAMGLFTAFQTWLYRRFFPETPLTFAPLWVLFEWAKTWVFTGFPWLFAGYAFTERYWMAMRLYLAFMQFHLWSLCWHVLWSKF